MVVDPLNGHLSVVPPTPKPFRREGMGYVYDPPSTGVRFRVDRISRNSDGFRARIEVESTLPGVPPHIYQGRHLLEGSRSLADLKKALEEITGPASNGAAALPWGTLIRQLTKGVVDAEEAGEPFQLIGRRPGQVRPPDTLEMLLPARKATQWYGPGSAGKGFMAIAACICVKLGIPLAGLAVTPGDVLYLDWEDDEESFAERLAMVADGMGVPVPDIHYRNCRRGGPLSDQITTVSRYVDQQHIALTVVDSVSMAAGGSGERSTYEETAIRLMSGVAQLASTVLLIDHVNAEGKEDKGAPSRSYGSVFKGYLCRSTWAVKKDQEAGAEVSHVGFYHTKTNHSKLYLPLGFCLDFGLEGKVQISREDVRESPSLAEPVGTAWRIKGYLEHNGARPIRLIATELELKYDTVKKTLERGEGKQFKRAIRGGGQDGDHWGVLC